MPEILDPYYVDPENPTPCPKITNPMTPRKKIESTWPVLKILIVFILFYHILMLIYVFLGGFVSEGRVNGNLNLSRALGDLEYKSNKDRAYDE